MADIGPEVQAKAFRDNLTIAETDDACLRHPFAQAPEQHGLSLETGLRRRFEVPAVQAAYPSRNFKSKGGTGAIDLLVPMTFRCSSKVGAARAHELRKVGA